MVRRLLLIATIGFAVLEAVMTFTTEFFVPALVFCLIFAFGAWRVLAGKAGKPTLWLLAVAFFLEVLGVPFYDRVTTADWITQMTALALGLLGLVTSIATLATRRRNLAATDTTEASAVASGR